MNEHTEADGQVDAFETGFAWRGGAIAGAIAAVLVAVVIAVMDVDLLRSIAALYGLGDYLIVGALIHVVHGVIFGVIFAFVLMDPALFGVTGDDWRVVAFGLVYGLFLAVTAAGIVMPIWLSVIGFADAPPVPNIDVPILAWHLVYGAVLGFVFPYVTDRFPVREP